MFVYPKKYDVIVLGAGHAGIEAALAAARMGCPTLLLTINADTAGQMSCNPAIGGLAKGHLAREIDAMGGEMGLATDMTGLQFRMLNTKKGPAVWAPRAQCDKKAYQFRMKWVCERERNLDFRQAQCSRLLHKGDRVYGVETTLQVQYLGETVVVTTGTFLKGLMHIGTNQQSGGRAGEAAATGLSASLKEVGLELGRLKTGTPPRLLRRSIDFSRTEIQPGDEPVPYFTHWKEDLFHVEHNAEGRRPRLRRTSDGLPTQGGEDAAHPVRGDAQLTDGVGMFHVEHSADGTRLPHLDSGQDRLSKDPAPCPLPAVRTEDSSFVIRHPSFPPYPFPAAQGMECGALTSAATNYPPGSILAAIGGQLPCYITYTTEATARIIRDNLDKSPLYSGIIQGVGPRYCPSIEDKIVKFPEKERQQLFLEPEGIATDEIYVNGFSTSLPFEVQVSMVRTIIGCEQAEILRPAYAVEYDFAFPTQIQPSLETKI